MGLRSLSCLLLLVLVPASRQASTCTNLDPCTGQPDCTACTVNELVPDPENCRGFYLCIDNAGTMVPSDLPFECGAGQVFNATTRTCVTGTTCESCPVVPPTGSCTYDCASVGADDPISSFTDCGTYYICDASGGISGSATCEPSKPFFNGVECQTDEKLCCHCKPYCESTDVGNYIADPVDCRGYYYCTAAGVPTLSGTCDDGENFDTFLGQCSASAPCSTQTSCLNVVAPDGCIDPFTCVTTGYFARCPDQCTPDYYHCTAATGTFQDAQSCTNGLVFHPDSHTCVTEDNCPY